MMVRSGVNRDNRQRGSRLLLMLSGLLNVVLIAYLCYDVRGGNPSGPSKRLSEPSSGVLLDDRTNSEVLVDFRQMSLKQLIAKLSDTRLVEDGYSQSDLALACLVAFHHFDLPKALLGQPQPTQQRQLVIQGEGGLSSAAIIVYPSLSDEQYRAIVQFAETERWPLTSLGLFHLLQQPGYKDKPSLREAFYLTPEFLAVEMLFNRSEAYVDKTQLLDLVLAGEWSTVSRFARAQRRRQDLSVGCRQTLLLDYLVVGAVPAAELLLQTDRIFAVRKLDDHTVVRMLELLGSPTSDARRFAKDLLTGPRSNMVRQSAAANLYRYEGEVPPDPIDYMAAVKRFAPDHANDVVATGRETAVASGEAEEIIHTVKRGDSLWKISRQYKVKIETIRQVNDLRSDFLKPGRRLVIRRSR